MSPKKQKQMAVVLDDFSDMDQIGYDEYSEGAKPEANRTKVLAIHFSSFTRRPFAHKLVSYSNLFLL